MSRRQLFRLRLQLVTLSVGVGNVSRRSGQSVSRFADLGLERRELPGLRIHQLVCLLTSLLRFRPAKLQSGKLLPGRRELQSGQLPLLLACGGSGLQLGESACRRLLLGKLPPEVLLSCHEHGDVPRMRPTLIALLDGHDDPDSEQGDDRDAQSERDGPA
ncbi:hypothetical protein [Methylobacterium sp. WL6]|uniref:hypothetical protein n=1 Tax=Methylobacterium sp. WL6 TaxID=2603901 RepID=UPI0011CC13CD|nr:hypothetical protein [Methylobacterium sp. WL6]TXN68129.1 hypothetical protein FV230_13440 [Methylobacterium sp. WL6]